MGARGPKPACDCGDCSACKKRARERRWRMNTPDKQREYREARKEYQRAYREANRERLSAADLRRYHEGEKHKWTARRLVNDAIAAGRMERGPCAVCGTTELIEGHHPDYSKPLEVRWLCRAHHVSLHVVERMWAEAVG